jgi:hypothetical protein
MYMLIVNENGRRLVSVSNTLFIYRLESSFGSFLQSSIEGLLKLDPY